MQFKHVTLDFDAAETSGVRTVRLDRQHPKGHIHSDLGGLNSLPRWMEQTGGRPPPWVVDFWRSQVAFGDATFVFIDPPTLRKLARLAT